MNDEQVLRQHLRGYYSTGAEAVRDTEPGSYDAALTLLELLVQKETMKDFHRAVRDLEFAQWPMAQEEGSYHQQRSDVYCQCLHILNGAEQVPQSFASLEVWRREHE